jgi:hypothetical protein
MSAFEISSTGNNIVVLFFYNTRTQGMLSTRNNYLTDHGYVHVPIEHLKKGDFVSIYTSLYPLNSSARELLIIYHSLKELQNNCIDVHQINFPSYMMI